MDEIAERVKNVLRKYFEYDDNGHPNENYDETFEAQSAIDEIHEIIGNI